MALGKEDRGLDRREGKRRLTTALWIVMSITAILMFFEVALSGVGT